jgi:hypothetical protein
LAAHHTLVIGPGNHCGHLDLQRGGLALWRSVRRELIAPLEQWYLRRFDRWLQGKGDGLAGLKAFNQGEGGTSPTAAPHTARCGGLRAHRPMRSRGS